MKNLLFTFLILLGLAACTSANPTQEIVKTMDEAATKIHNVKDAQELNKINTDLASQIQAIKEKYPDYKPTDEEQKSIMEATKKLETALLGKSSLLMESLAAPASPELPEKDE